MNKLVYHLNILFNFVLEQLYAKKQIEFVDDGNNDFCDYLKYLAHNNILETNKNNKNRFKIFY